MLSYMQRTHLSIMNLFIIKKKYNLGHLLGHYGWWIGTLHFVKMPQLQICVNVILEEQHICLVKQDVSERHTAYESKTVHCPIFDSYLISLKKDAG